MEGISIIIPVGPNPAYIEYLFECLESIIPQMGEEDEIVFVDDQAFLEKQGVLDPYLLAGINYPVHYKLHKNEWLLGCSNSWNIGVRIASNEWCLLMGSDDKLMEGCLDACKEVLFDNPDPLGYYNIACETSSGEHIGIHNNAAVVSKALWKETGGFPISAALGAPDALLISIMLVHMSEHLRQINAAKPYYWVREHENQDTKIQGAFFSGEVLSIRNKETERWKRPEWTSKL